MKTTLLALIYAGACTTLCLAQPVQVNAGVGVISGTPTTVGTFSGTVTATNGTAPDATQNFSIVISAVAPPPSPGTPIPTLSEWALLLLSALLAISAIALRRRL